MSLAAKMAEIYLKVDRFAKSKQITGGGPKFKYTPVEEIADALREAMGNRGIVMVPEEVEVLTSEAAGVTSSGNTIWRHVLRVVWHITDGTDSLRVASVGEANDASDKGANKAQTAARKYALIGAFQLSTGDDPDARHPEPAARRPGRSDWQGDPPPPRNGTVDVKARARELMGLAGDKTALTQALFSAGIGSSQFADEKTWERAQQIAREVAGQKPSAPPSADPDRGEPAPAEEPQVPGQTRLGGSL